MIESFLTQNLITRGEKAIGDYLRSDQSDFSDIWKESFGDMMLEFDTMDLKVKQLCERLSLQTSVTKTATFTGSLSDQDYAERMRLVIPVSAITGNAVFTLQGSDNEGSNYTDIEMIADDSTSATTHTLSAVKIGVDSASFQMLDSKEKYRLKLISISIGTTVTYTAYIIENIYTVLHRDLTRMQIYETLMGRDREKWIGKFEEYEKRYNRRLADGIFRVDYSDDQAISEAEGEKRSSQIRFRV